MNKERDWKAFRKMVPELRERYLERHNEALKEILKNDSATPTEKFWVVEKRVNKEARILRQCLDGHSRSRMLEFMRRMYSYEMLTDLDLKGFSAETQSRVIGA